MDILYADLGAITEDELNLLIGIYILWLPGLQVTE